jgi:hypothetical protein
MLPQLNTGGELSTIGGGAFSHCACSVAGETINDSRAAANLPSRDEAPPWIIEDNGACFIVRDHNRQALAYVQ